MCDSVDVFAEWKDLATDYKQLEVRHFKDIENQLNHKYPLLYVVELQ